MCGIIGYIGEKEATKILINGLKKLEYGGSLNEAEHFNQIPYNCNGHEGWAKQKFINSNNFSTKMNLTNIIKRGKYYVQIDETLRNEINSRIIIQKKIFSKLKISRNTLYRIRKDKNYWVNYKTLSDLCKLIKINNKILESEILFTKTKNSPIKFQKIFLNENLARILGHIVGDGGIHIKKLEGKYRAFYVNNEQILLNSFKEDIYEVFDNNEIYSREREIRGDEIWLNTSIGFILYTLLEYDLNNDKKSVPSIMKKSGNKKILGKFLQAIYDDDGFLYPSKKMVVLSLVRKELLSDIRKILIKIGVVPNKILIHNSKSRSKMFYFSITGRNNIKKFDKLVGFLHPIKKDKLKNLLGGYKQCAE